MKLFTTYRLNNTEFLNSTDEVLGIRKTRQIPSIIESKVKFNDTPKVFASNIDSSKLFKIKDFANGNIPNTFSILNNLRVGDILSYNLVLPGQFNCFNMIVGEYMTFLNTTNWATFTHQGSGQFTLDLVGNKLDCISDGSIFNLKIFDANGDLIKYFPIVFGSGTTAYEVVDYTQHATLPNPAGWGFQNIFNYNGVYGAFNSEPTNYIGRLKRSGQSVLGNAINNQSELKTKGDIAFKAMAFTKSEL